MIPTAHAAWCEAAAHGVAALRLNRHFPPRDTVVAWLTALAHTPCDWDPARGLPAGPGWLALDAWRAEAPAARARWSTLDVDALPADARATALAHRAAVERALSLPPLPRSEVTVRLRHRAADRASYEVVVDRFDPGTTTLARYTLHLVDRPGPRLADGELELDAAEHFARGLARLADHDAALAFAVLEANVLAVEEVVRGVIGPGVAAGVGPDLGFTPATLVLSACLERASVDLSDGVVDDPLVHSVVVPARDAPFGVSRRRKWAARLDDVPAVRAWLDRIGSRNLVYPWSADGPT